MPHRYVFSLECHSLFISFLQQDLFVCGFLSFRTFEYGFSINTFESISAYCFSCECRGFDGNLFQFLASVECVFADLLYILANGDGRKIFHAFEDIGGNESNRYRFAVDLDCSGNSDLSGGFTLGCCDRGGIIADCIGKSTDSIFTIAIFGRR